MDYRKLINFGNTSLVISLPKEWLKSHGLAKGDFLYLQHEHDRLILLPKEKEEEKEAEQEIEIQVDDAHTDMLKRRVIGAYVNGYDQLVFTGKTIPKRSSEIRSIIQSLIALEIVEESTAKLIAKGFLNMKEVNLDQNVRRTDNMLRCMLTDTLLMFKPGQPKKAEMNASIATRDNDVNKMVFLTYRYVNYCLSRKRTPDNFTTHHLLRNWLIANYQEKIGDDIKRVARSLTDISKKELIQEAEEIITKCHRFYETAMKGIYTEDKEAVYKAAQERKHVLVQLDALMEHHQNRSILRFCEQAKRLLGDTQDVIRLGY